MIKIGTNKLISKKTLLSLILVPLMLVGSYNIISASSGACSWHGGVDCISGADWDGSVICNDGWRDSNVSYNSMSECNNVDYQCTKAELESLWEKHGIKEIQSKLNESTASSNLLMQQIADLTNQETAEIENVDAMGMSADWKSRKETEIHYKYNKLKASIAIQLNVYTAQMSMYQSQLDDADKWIGIECNALGYDRVQKYRIERLKYQQELQEKLAEEEKSNLEKLLKESQDLLCPENAYYLDGECFCEESYTWDVDACVTPDQYCKRNFGLKSYEYEKHCLCKTGYEFNSDTICVKKVICPINSIKKENDCVCKGGYEWNSSKTSCIKKIEISDIETSIEKEYKPEQVIADGNINIASEEEKNEQNKKEFLNSTFSSLADVSSIAKSFFLIIFSWFLK